MPNILTCDGFPRRYQGLNGMHALLASHLDITRAMLTVGYPSRRSAIRCVGIWRALLLRSMVRGYLNAALNTTAYFHNLEQSEKGAMSFLLGQAFTYWFAQTHMNVPYVVHVRGARERWTHARGARPMKRGAGPLNPRARPDFIGRSANQYHVFESKGRSGRITGPVIAGALAQASMIATVNGQAPRTRVAACFSFQANGVTGHVKDPPTAPTSLDLRFDDLSAAEKTYAFFLQPDVREDASKLIPEFQCVELGDGLVYGIDPEVVKTLDDLSFLAEDKRTVEPLLQLLEQRRGFYAERCSRERSVGPDGVILSKSPPPPPARIRRRRMGQKRP